MCTWKQPCHTDVYIDWETVIISPVIDPTSAWILLKEITVM